VSFLLLPIWLLLTGIFLIGVQASSIRELPVAGGGGAENGAHGGHMQSPAQEHYDDGDGIAI
jgi:hypothetical protein